MIRRRFLSLLAGLPLAGRFTPESWRPKRATYYIPFEAGYYDFTAQPTVGPDSELSPEEWSKLVGLEGDQFRHGIAYVDDGAWDDDFDDEPWGDDDDT